MALLEWSFLKDQKIQKLEIQLRKFEQRQSEMINRFDLSSQKDDSLKKKSTLKKKFSSSSQKSLS